MGGPSLSAGHNRFSKRVHSIPIMDLGHSVAKKNFIILTKRSLVSKFLGLWPNPRIVLEWISKDWNEQDPTTVFYCGKCFYVFIF
jgi:hypothetical protein